MQKSYILIKSSEQYTLNLVKSHSMQKQILKSHSSQLSFHYDEDILEPELNYSDKLVKLLNDDLDFHRLNSKYATHNFHSFPAKFPPQLPLKFILSLTDEGDIVLDPMMGSGTTIVEACFHRRRAIGFDIDPLAVMITKVKTARFDAKELMKQLKSILADARKLLDSEKAGIEEKLASQWDAKSKEFIDYWFAHETQLELMALLSTISTIKESRLKTFFELAFSATIITKSGGVSLALDLAHTRPHKAKIIVDKQGKMIHGGELRNDSNPRLEILTKKLRSAIEEFEKRCLQNIRSFIQSQSSHLEPDIYFGNAQALPLKNNTVDLIVTSPPYASNAIDYMRAHKFSLIWLGYPLDDLGSKRKTYIGGEDTTTIQFEDLPATTTAIISQIRSLDPKRGQVLHRYYSEMKRVLKEMYRVLKPQKAAIVVVGSSIMRGKDTQTQNCLAEIGKSIGFHVPKIGVRNLDRNKRMMPAGATVDSNSQIQQRMHVEYVIGFQKP